MLMRLLSGATATAQTTLADGTLTGQIKFIVATDVTNAVDVDIAETLMLLQSKDIEYMYQLHEMYMLLQLRG